MKVIRFVTQSELAMYLSGAKLLNADKHLNNSTSSVGFCFAEITPERDADKWLRKLFAIRPCERVIEFDTDRFATPLKETKARYADDEHFDSQTAEFREWCTTEYSLRTHPYTRIGICPTLVQILGGFTIAWNWGNK